MADYIRTVPQKSFTMDTYRISSGDESAKCNSVGCVIGHCTILDEQLFNRLSPYGIFEQWSYLFTELFQDSPQWDWCFNGLWSYCDDTPTGAADRIEWLLSNGLPENWRAQMVGDAPLCYKK